MSLSIYQRVNLRKHDLPLRRLIQNHKPNHLGFSFHQMTIQRTFLEYYNPCVFVANSFKFDD